MAMSLPAIVSAIENHIRSGLDGVVAITNYSHLQIAYECVLERSTFMLEASEKNMFKPTEFATRIPEIRLISDLKDVDHPIGTNGAVLCWVPRPAKVFGDQSVQFLGSQNQESGMKVYFDEAFRHHCYSMSTAKRPYAWIDMTTERVTPDKVRECQCWVFNKPASFKRALMARMVPEDLPVEEMLFDEMWMFPAPDAIIKQIIQKITEKYIRYYRNLSYSPAQGQQDIPPSQDQIQQQ